MIQYQSHGSVDITVEDKIIYIETTGPWNLEYFSGFHEELLLASAHLKSEKFAVLLTVKGEAICSLDAIEAHIEFLKKSTVSGIAINYEQCITAKISTQIFTDMYERAGIQFSFFEDNVLAKAWLQSLIEP